MRKISVQQGWTAAGALGTILSAAVGSIAFEHLMRLIPHESALATPWVLVSLFLLPATFCIQLLLKLWDLKELDGLSRREKSRLKQIIDEKTRQLFIAIGYYVLSAVFVVAMFLFTSNEPHLFKVSIVTTGGLLGISLFSIGLIFSETKNVADFRAELKERSEAKQKQDAGLKRLLK